MLLALTLGSATLAAACDGGRTTGASAPTSTASAAKATTSAVGSTTAPTGSASASATESVAASSSAAPADPDAVLDTPQLFEADGKTPLGQIDTRPSTDSPAFKRRMELLWNAIVTDDPESADRAFFPAIAYEQVKDIKNPKSDWKNRLLKAFHRNIHGYHKKLGKHASELKFLGVEIDEPRAKLMGRGKEGNKLTYWRVTRSKIRYEDEKGKARSLELTSLISWRGEWFVVHLDGFK
ncbi:MAG: hypothetical protein U0271_01060 [Polyangiaceae bacterium]